MLIMDYEWVGIGKIILGLGKFIFFLLILRFVLFTSGKLASEVRQEEDINNANVSEPSDQKIKWHITHIRDDMAMAVLLLQALVILSALNLFWG